MTTDAQPRFRPTMYIDLGAEGAAAAAQLAKLTPGMDDARRAGVAMLSVPTQAVSDTSALYGSWFAAGGQAEAPQPLQLLVVEALRGQGAKAGAAGRRGILDDGVIARIQESGYMVPRAMATVWIVAAADSPLLAAVARDVRAALASERVEGWVLLALLNDYPRDPALHEEHARRCAKQPWQELLVGTQGGPLATYAYLFETRGERGTFWEGTDDVPYAAAEAMFFLTATGITTTREYEEMLRRSLPQMVRQPYERMSGVGTSRLLFPRGHVEEYCADTLGATLMRSWAETQAVELAPAEVYAQKQAAQKAAQGLRQMTGDSEALLRGGRPSPRVSAESTKKSPQNGGRPTPDGGMIFRHFSQRELDRLSDGRLDLPQQLAQQATKAEDGFGLWKQRIRASWEDYETQFGREMTTRASTLMLEGPAGVTRSRAFLAELSDALEIERERLTRRREDRAVDYMRFLVALEKRTAGPWLEEEAGIASLPAPVERPYGQEYLPQPQYRPQFAPASASTSATPVLVPVLSVGVYPSAPAPITLDALTPPPLPATPTREDGVMEQLTRRYRWRLARQPHSIALIAAALVAIPPLALLGQALLPARWMANHFATLWLTLLLVALVALGSWALRSLCVRQTRLAADDIRSLYGRIFADRCERHEDERREALLTGVMLRARRVAQRLAEWETFSRDMATTLEDEADQIERNLFDGAAGRRNVLVANRRRLHREDYPLQALEQDISMKRRRRPLEGEEWHGDVSEMLPRLRAHLRHTASLAEGSASEITGPVKAFCAAVVRPYCSGEIADLGAVLDALPPTESTSIYDALTERSTILYRSVDPAHGAVVFSAAREEYEAFVNGRGQPAEVVRLPIEDREWMGVLRLLPGGATPTFALVDGAPANVPPLQHAPTWSRPVG